MKLREALTLLRSGDVEDDDLFGLLQAVAAGLEAHEELERSEARDALIRCLELRDRFGQLSEILDSLLHRSGLFQYENLDDLEFRDHLAVETHRYFDGAEVITLHSEQERVLRRLLDGENLVLSAPTSFGKSKLIDILLAEGRFNQVVLIVPTIALIDETRRRLAKFSSEYKIISHAKQRQRSRNIFVMTAERFLNTKISEKVDFFAIDEFYKLGFSTEEDQRVSALNQAFYRLLKTGAQFYLLGPLVQRIPAATQRTFDCHFHYTQFATVAVNQHRVRGNGPPEERLKGLVRKLRGQTLLYCQSPNRAADTLNDLLETRSESQEVQETADWLAEAFHPAWSLVRGMRRGIGLHHGRLPRSLSQWAVRLFNREQIQLLVCTSSLIEGVNTSARNVIIYDNKIARRSLDYFTFNNIKGRTGRMFRHFVGDVYLFSEPPEEVLPFVDIPLVSQTANAPASVLLQMDERDLLPASRERIQGIAEQSQVSLSTLRAVPEMEPEQLMAMAKALDALSLRRAEFLNWSRRPTWDQLRQTCELLWSVWGSARLHGVTSGAQLAFKIVGLQHGRPYRDQIDAELNSERYPAKTVDEAVNRVFDFERFWATHQMPRWLNALEVLVKRIFNFDCRYSGYANQVEALFRPQYQSILEEFGVPIQISQKLSSRFRSLSEVDEILTTVRQVRNLGELTRFERDIFHTCVDGI